MKYLPWFLLAVTLGVLAQCERQKSQAIALAKTSQDTADRALKAIDDWKSEALRSLDLVHQYHALIMKLPTNGVWLQFVPREALTNIDLKL